MISDKYFVSCILVHSYTRKYFSRNVHCASTKFFTFVTSSPSQRLQKCGLRTWVWQKCKLFVLHQLFEPLDEIRCTLSKYHKHKIICTRMKPFVSGFQTRKIAKIFLHCQKQGSHAIICTRKKNNKKSEMRRKLKVESRKIKMRT